MGYLPIFVDVTGRPCLVIGGGAVAERKVATLLELDASIKVVSPRLTARLRHWVAENAVVYESRTYRNEDLKGQQMVFAATNDEAINRMVSEAARKQQIWVNAADDPRHCDFISPAVVRRGPVIVAISTGGSSPALARLIREELEDRVTEDYAAMAHCAAEVRRELQRQSKSVPPDAWRNALDSKFRALTAKGREAEARAHLRARLEKLSCGQMDPRSRGSHEQSGPDQVGEIE